MGKDEFWLSLSGYEIKEIFYSIFEAIQEGVIIVDIDGIIRYMNPAVMNMTGWDEKQVINNNINNLHPNGPLAKVIQTQKPIYDEKHKMKASNLEVSATTLPIYVKDEIVGAVSLFRDVTEIFRLSGKLAESRTLINDLNSKLANMAVAKYGFDDLKGVSPIFMESLNVSKRAAKTDSTVLIRGESGTGKELFASSIHKASRRGRNAFVKVNCAAIPDNLLESEFFGYEKGAFTGAVTRKLGMFELAHGGTIFLDEIGDMPPSLQVKLLRVLEEGEIYRLGGTKPIKVNVRVIAATNRNLENMVKKETFREDLFYRLNVINVEIPPLRSRKEDILVLANFILETTLGSLGKVIKGFTPKACEVLTKYNWPGNVRELRNCVERAAIMSEGNFIHERDLQFLLPSNDEVYEPDMIMPLERLEKEMIEKALNHFGKTVNGKKEAAKNLKISLRTLYNKIHKYKLE